MQSEALRALWMSSASRGPQPISLLEACIDALAGGIEHVERLTGISEELALALFDEVIRRGKLNPRVRRLPLQRTLMFADNVPAPKHVALLLPDYGSDMLVLPPVLFPKLRVRVRMYGVCASPVSKRWTTHCCQRVGHDTLLEGLVVAAQVLQLFDETRHELLLQRIQALNLQPLPPVLNTTSARWLGDRPGFY